MEIFSTSPILLRGVAGGHGVSHETLGDLRESRFASGVVGALGRSHVASGGNKWPCGFADGLGGCRWPYGVTSGHGLIL
jgi:hypothetical protein